MEPNWNQPCAKLLGILSWIIIQNSPKVFLLLAEMLAGSCLCPDSLCCSANPIVQELGIATGQLQEVLLTSQQSEQTSWACLFTVCNKCSGRENKHPSVFCVNQQLGGCRPAQAIELLAVVRLMGSRLCCGVLWSSWLSKQGRAHVNAILKVDLFTASLNPACNESPGHALRLNSTDNLCPQRNNSSLSPYLGREETSSNKACAVLWRQQILCVVIQDSWVSSLLVTVV